MLHSRTAVAALAAFSVASIGAQGADQLTSSQITQVVREVSVIDAKAKTQKPAAIASEFRVPDILKTGAESRAEMIAPDRTVTRVGANTLFSFEPQGREINLEKGSLLFHSPTGKGGGSVRTASVTASVMGTTLMVGTTENGGFKVMLLEGTGRVRTANGTVRTLQAGQLVYALPGGALSPVMAFRLSQVVKSSQLVSGFTKPLASLPKIQAAILRQETQVQKGRLQDTGVVAGNSPGTGFRVDVVSRESQIQPARADGSPLLRALNSDAVLGPLTQERLFTGEFSNFLPEILKNLEGTLTPGAATGSNLIPGTDFGLPSSSTLFAARNLVIERPFLSLTGSGTVLLASDSIFVPGQTLLVSPSGPVALVANRELRFAPGARLSFESPDAYVGMFGGALARSFRSSAFELGEGQLLLRGPESGITNDFNKGLPDMSTGMGGRLNVYAPDILLQDGAFMAATGELSLLAGRDLVVNGIPLGGNQGGDSPSLQFGPMFSQGLQSFELLDVRAGGNVLLTQTVVSSDRMNLRADNDLRANSTDFSVILNPGNSDSQFGTKPDSRALLSAGSLLSLQSVNFIGISDISLQARTLVLSDVNFPSGSQVNLRSENGALAPAPNTNKPVRPGFVNFVRDVKYGGLLMGGASPIPSAVKFSKR
jgi:hypothetical protein